MPSCSTVTTSKRQEVERQIFDERSTRCSKPRGGWVTVGRSDAGAKVGTRGDRHRRRPTGGKAFHRPDEIIAATARRSHKGQRVRSPDSTFSRQLKDCSSGLIAYGGHAAAATGSSSLPTNSPPSLSGLKNVAVIHSPANSSNCAALRSTRKYRSGVLSLAVVNEIEMLEPHGISNPRPLLLATGLEVVGEPRPVGEKKNHLQMRLRQGDHISARRLPGTWPRKEETSRPGRSFRRFF